jgi:hypothetical protein
MQLINQHRYGPDITLRLKGVTTSFNVHLSGFSVTLPLTVIYWATSLDRETVHYTAYAINSIYIEEFKTEALSTSHR